MEILLGIGFFVGAVALLSVGTVLLRRPIQGSCGGAARLFGRWGGTCGACGRPFDECPERDPEKDPRGSA
jgi:hypothetical protein